MSSTFIQQYTDLPDKFYSHISTDPLNNAKLIHCNQSIAQELGIDLNEEEILAMTAGHKFPDGFMPVAQKYTGHQFGYYNPDLGDGRGVLLGQVKTTNSDNGKEELWDIHLKGCGQTPYSRRGDGRAVLRSALREYMIGEALHGLGIPTTRCLSLCSNDEWVRREQLEPRASYIRVAKTHIRFGHFEWLAQQNDRVGSMLMAEYVIETVYPELQDIADNQTRHAALLNLIVQNTAKMIAAWQVVGFCHGVMNTDNMSVAGETFDFGPYAFLDDCQIHYICNHSDTEGRYAYSQQPNIGLWNCRVLANSFSQLVSSEDIDTATNLYIDTFNQTYLQKMGYKFGLTYPVESDKDFIAETLILLDQSRLDFHLFFTYLAKLEHQADEFFNFVGDSKAWQLWSKKYFERIKTDDSAMRSSLFAQNHPQLIFRNYIAQELIEHLEVGHYSVIDTWIAALKKPYQIDENGEIDQQYLQAPKNHQKSIALSCSS